DPSGRPCRPECGPRNTHRSRRTIIDAMPKHSRREFLSLSAMAAGAASVAQLRPSEAFPGPTRVSATLEPPDLILVNGRVLTQDPSLPRAEAFAISRSRFVAVGSNSDVRNLANANTRVIDAGGATVLPGFIDCHCHPSGITELYDVDANLRSVRAIQDAL